MKMNRRIKTSILLSFVLPLLLASISSAHAAGSPAGWKFSITVTDGEVIYLDALEATIDITVANLLLTPATPATNGMYIRADLDDPLGLYCVPGAKVTVVAKASYPRGGAFPSGAITVVPVCRESTIWSEDGIPWYNTGYADVFLNDVDVTAGSFSASRDRSTYTVTALDVPDGDRLTPGCWVAIGGGDPTPGATFSAECKWSN